MKGTKRETKYCQLQFEFEGLVGADSTECERNPRVYDSSLVLESNNTNRIVVKEQLLERIIEKGNFREAMKQVIRNKGSHGVDGMSVDELRDFLNTNWDTLKQILLAGKYHPQPVRRVEIPKDNGKTRKLGIPTAVDRVIQQAIAQVVSPIYEPMFHDNSYGFRPKRSAQQAIHKCMEYMNDGYRYVIDMDLEKYFDTVNHDKVVALLTKNIQDGRVISLIHRYMRAGVLVGQKFEKTEIGVPQGGPLSPLLSNIMLNELDQELERRGHRFARYADDIVIFLKTRRSAERVKKTITKFIEERLKLVVNKEKTVVARAAQIKFLGFGFYFNKEGARARVHQQSVKKLKDKIRMHTQKSRGNVSNEARPLNLRRLIMGWVNYFKIADMKVLLHDIDEWMRTKIRVIYWKQWKKIKTRYERLKALGMQDNEAYRNACTRKGYWRVAHSPVLGKTLTNEVLEVYGYIYFSDYYKTVNL